MAPNRGSRCGCSSSGRAPPCQGGGSEFEPRHPLQFQFTGHSARQFYMVPWPSGKARVCKTLMPQFKSGRHLQKKKSKSKDLLFFFNEINPRGICEMPCGREIWLYYVKCAAARGGFISFHFLRSRKFHNAQALFHILRQQNISPSLCRGTMLRLTPKGKHCKMVSRFRKKPSFFQRNNSLRPVGTCCIYLYRTKILYWSHSSGIMKKRRTQTTVGA